jgi:hypothetical protein
LEREERLLKGRGWEYYNGYNVTFQPQQMNPAELLQAHRALWRAAFSFNYAAKRSLRSIFRLRLGAVLLSLMMNGFYCLKRLRNNAPLDLQRQGISERQVRGRSVVAGDMAGADGRYYTAAKCENQAGD